MKCAFVTGASSFLGINLVRRFLDAGIAVHALVRSTTDRVPFERMTRGATLHEHDGTLASINAAFDACEPQVVFHLATKYLRQHRPEDIDDLIEANIRFGAQLLEAMVSAGIKRLVNTGSAFQHFEVEGDDAYRPLNLYAATKQAFDDILAFYADAHGVKSVTLKLFDVYGPGDSRPKLMTAVREAQLTGTPLPLPGDDGIELDYAYVDDVVDAFVHAAQLLETDPEPVAGRSFAVSSGHRHTFEEIIAAFEAVDGRPVKRAWGSYTMPERVIRNPWRGPSLPGWRATTSLKDGIRRMLSAENRE